MHQTKFLRTSIIGLASLFYFYFFVKKKNYKGESILKIEHWDNLYIVLEGLHDPICVQNFIYEFHAKVNASYQHQLNF